MPKEKYGKTVKTQATTNSDKTGDKKIKNLNKPKSNSLEQAILNTEMQILVAKEAGDTRTMRLFEKILQRFIRIRDGQ